MRKEINYSGFTFTLNPPFGIDLKISKLGFLTAGVPDVFYTCIKENECEYKHKEFEYDIFKSPTPALRIAEEQKRKSKDNFFMKPFEYKNRWDVLTNDNLVYCHSETFIEDLKKKQKKPRIFNKFLFFSAVAIIFSLWLYIFFGIFVLTLFFIFVREIAHYDDRCIISVLFYDMDEKHENAFDLLKQEFLKKTDIHLIVSKGKNKTAKKNVNVAEGHKQQIKTNIDLITLTIDNDEIIVFPDKLVIFYKDGRITGYDYREMAIKSGKVKTKSGDITSYLSMKTGDDFHLLFYINKEDTAKNIYAALMTLQNRKKT